MVALVTLLALALARSAAAAPTVITDDSRTRQAVPALDIPSPLEIPPVLVPSDAPIQQEPSDNPVADDLVVPSLVTDDTLLENNDTAPVPPVTATCRLPEVGLGGYQLVWGDDCPPEGLATAAECHLACAEGYQYTGNPANLVVRCSEDGTLAVPTEMPVCVPIAAPCDLAAANIVSEHVVVGTCTESLPAGSECHFNCAEGYRATNDTAMFVRCTDAGELVMGDFVCEPLAIDTPVCSLLETALPEHLSLGTDCREELAVGQYCHLACEDGYTDLAHENLIITCTEGGKLDVPTPQCKPIGCILPDLSGNGLYEFVCDDGNGGVAPAPAGLELGQTCAVRCANGSVQTAGNVTLDVSCSQDGTLSRMPFITCTPQAAACALPDFTPAAAAATTADVATGATNIDRNSCLFDHLAPGQSCTVKCPENLVTEATGEQEVTYTCPSEGGQLAEPSTAPVCVTAEPMHTGDPNHHVLEKVPALAPQAMDFLPQVIGLDYPGVTALPPLEAMAPNTEGDFQSVDGAGLTQVGMSPEDRAVLVESLKMSFSVTQAIMTGDPFALVGVIDPICGLVDIFGKGVEVAKEDPTKNAIEEFSKSVDAQFKDVRAELTKMDGKLDQVTAALQLTRDLLIELQGEIQDLKLQEALGFMVPANSKVTIAYESLMDYTVMLLNNTDPAKTRDISRRLYNFLTDNKELDAVYEAMHTLATYVLGDGSLKGVLSYAPLFVQRGWEQCVKANAADYSAMLGDGYGPFDATLLNRILHDCVNATFSQLQDTTGTRIQELFGGIMLQQTRGLMVLTAAWGNDFTQDPKLLRAMRNMQNIQTQIGEFWPKVTASSQVNKFATNLIAQYAAKELVLGPDRASHLWLFVNAPVNCRPDIPGLCDKQTVDFYKSECHRTIGYTCDDPETKFADTIATALRGRTIGLCRSPSFVKRLMNPRVPDQDHTVTGDRKPEYVPDGSFTPGGCKPWNYTADQLFPCVLPVDPRSPELLDPAGYSVNKPGDAADYSIENAVIFHPAQCTNDALKHKSTKRNAFLYDFAPATVPSLVGSIPPIPAWLQNVTAAVGKLLPTGQPCNSSDLCSSHMCALWSQGKPVPAKTLCCPVAVPRKINGVYYCAGLPVGSGCTSDDMCESRLCAIKRGATSGYCGRTSATGQGATCADDRECKDGLSCLNGNVCGKPQGGNALCDSDKDCQNESCALRTAGGQAPRVCCPWGAGRTEYKGEWYCNMEPDGAACLLHDVCRSGNCVGRRQSTGGRGTCGYNCKLDYDCGSGLCGKDGKCVAKGLPGTECFEDNDCNSKKCNPDVGKCL